MRILVIDDDENLVSVIKRQLEHHAFIVESAHDGKQGSYMARSEHYDLVILDNMLPEKSGVEVCKEIRESGKHIPILMLSACTDTDDKVHLLNLGADDYVTKPFLFRELLARIKSLLRRPQEIQAHIIEICGLTLNTTTKEVSYAGTPINLTQKEYLIFEYLVRNRGNVISRASLLDTIWGLGIDQFSKSIEAHLSNLRKKIPIENMIRTISGRGYIID